MEIEVKVGYPDNWFQIATEVKEKAGWKCVRCGHKDDKESGYMLTVHHLDLDVTNNERWNLAALCQKCHLKLQGKSRTAQKWIRENKEWFIICIIEKQIELFIEEESENEWYKPYVEGYIKSKEIRKENERKKK